jgi:MerR family mercuric resistance operon transcriptional regulator
MRPETFTIGRLAKAAGVNVETVRYYQRRRLLAVPIAVGGGIRRYSRDMLRRLRFIKRAQQLGFTLDEISDLLKLGDGNQCSIVCGVAERRLADIEKKIADLASMQHVLRGLVGGCQVNQIEAIGAACPLVEAFNS